MCDSVGLQSGLSLYLLQLYVTMYTFFGVLTNSVLRCNHVCAKLYGYRGVGDIILLKATRKNLQVLIRLALLRQ